ncbi:hypothetical protein D3C76_1233690 [compost metagenome]
MSSRNARRLAVNLELASAFICLRGTDMSPVMQIRKRTMISMPCNYKSCLRAMVRLRKFGSTAQGRRAAITIGSGLWI